MKVASTEQLQMLNSKAARLGPNRALPSAVYHALDPEGVHVVVPSMLHEDGPNLRCLVHMKMQASMEPQTFYLDILIDDYRMLVDAPDDEGE